ncbi:LDH2 family malate/lactate/ureidoglycolate dehydrogenase [Methylobacterium sp. PvR107]|nr:LDH2 family malate/lactate/ureidoglycolate dehydrogenase [Methylobacterium sp. PvR107]
MLDPNGLATVGGNEGDLDFGRPALALERDAEPLAQWGQVLTAHAMREAIRRAKAHGVSAVALRNSGHSGTALYFTLLAARDGCVAILSTNARPAMAPWGGRKKTVGTNPLLVRGEAREAE